MRKDGFRGELGTFWISESYYFRLPGVLSQLLGVREFVLGRDPRPSSEALYSAFLSGAKCCGLRITQAGMMPTPMLAKYAQDHQLLGIVISASHNPVDDNGVKFIGFTLNELERQEFSILIEKPISGARGSISCDANGEIQTYYLEELKKAVGPQSKRCLVDCAYGAWHPYLYMLEELGFSVDCFDQFNPRLINTSGCVSIEKQVSLYPKHYDYVLAFDGDGDRLQLVSRQRILDGDDILCHLSEKGVSVGTVLSNSVLDQALSEKGIVFHRTDVGDDNVYRSMKSLSARYGAESCGHVLDSNWMRYSDPVYIFSHAMDKGDVLALPKVYQLHLNLPLGVDIEQLHCQLSCRDVRLVIRKSNTESFIRVMMEGDSSIISELIQGYSLNSASI